MRCRQAIDTADFDSLVSTTSESPSNKIASPRIIPDACLARVERADGTGLRTRKLEGQTPFMILPSLKPVSVKTTALKTQKTVGAC